MNKYPDLYSNVRGEYYSDEYFINRQNYWPYNWDIQDIGRHDSVTFKAALMVDHEAMLANTGWLDSGLL